MKRLLHTLLVYAKYPVFLLAAGIIACPLSAASFSWSFSPSGGAFPANDVIDIYAVFTNPEATNQSLEFLSWQFDLGTFAPYYTFVPFALSGSISGITVAPYSTSSAYLVGILNLTSCSGMGPSCTYPVAGASFDLGPSSVTECDPGISCFDSPVTVQDTGTFTATLDAPVVTTPEPVTWVMVFPCLAVMLFLGRARPGFFR